MLIVARRGTSVRPEVINMPTTHDLYAPSTACLQARAARQRGCTRKTAVARLRSWGDCEGQFSIDDLLVDIAAEQAAEQAAEGGGRS